MKPTTIVLLLCLLVWRDSHAGPEAFVEGPLITEFGKIAKVDSDMPITDGTALQVSFDVANQATEGELNRQIESAARLLNMHVQAGADPANLKLAIVVHGGASKDLLATQYYERRFGLPSKNAALLSQLMKHNVSIFLCGQSAAYHDIAKAQLVPSVKMALSAMSAHAVLQQQGYTLNPF